MRSSVRVTGCKPPMPSTASRQGHIQRLRRQLPCQFVLLEGIAPLLQRCLDALLDLH